MRVVCWLALGGCFAQVNEGDKADAAGDTASDPTSSGTHTTTGPTGTADEAAQVCVDEINRYRATLGLPALVRWRDAEACAGDQARQDSESGEAHGAFGQCGEWAQNECPGWPMPWEESIVDCLAMMWAEGPGEDFNLHGHYINMSNPDYTEVACGFYQTPFGDYWSVQDFR